MSNQDVTRADYCAVAIAEAFRGDGEILCNPIGNVPLIGGRLARASFEPDLAITDGLATLTANTPAVGRPDPDRVVEHWNPYRRMFELLWNGQRHVMMGASQVDRYGNQNLAAIGDWHKPKAQLLGFRRVVTNLCVIDFEATDATGVHCARLRSVHPWSSVDDVVAATGFELALPDDVPESRAPTADEVALLRNQIDPDGLAGREVPNE